MCKVQVYGLLSVGHPNCLHTTVASFLSQSSSHTVPHTPFWHISTLPSFELEPSTNFKSPELHSESVNIKMMVILTVAL